MNDKYYTPDIEEFHVGFLFETYESRHDRWKLTSIHNMYDYQAVFNLGLEKNRNGRVVNSSSIRVKYLDKEDIESFGFKEDTYDINHFKFIQAYCNDVKINNFECYNINKYQNLFFDNSNNAIYNVIITTTIGEKNIPKFIGTIKNKSELKQILKMIGYESK